MKNVTDRYRSGGGTTAWLQRLDSLLHAHAWLWRPQPYKELRPTWCERLPQLRDELLALDDETVRQMGDDAAALWRLLQRHLPQLAELESLTQLPPCEVTPLQELGPHFHSAIPGRKWRQIRRFVGALGPMQQPVIEWCGGKGHLGRLLAAQWQQPVVTLEYDEKLCREGERLAQRSSMTQRFLHLDVLTPQAARVLESGHAVALHACGELHRTLLREALRSGAPGFDIAPCCYYIGAGEHYQPFTVGLQLQLSRDDLRLAVTETVTAAGREVAKRDQEMAWKLGYEQLRRAVTGEQVYRPQKPIRKGWLALGFVGFCRQLAQREGLELPQALDFLRYEAQGWQRQREVMRLSLVRAAFRRAVELWLVLDMASHIEAHGYRVRVATFCERELTPRNIVISARTTRSG